MQIFLKIKEVLSFSKNNCKWSIRSHAIKRHSLINSRIAHALVWHIYHQRIRHCKLYSENILFNVMLILNCIIHYFCESFWTFLNILFAYYASIFILEQKLYLFFALQIKSFVQWKNIKYGLNYSILVHFNIIPYFLFSISKIV